jgi:hypothetical protein
VRLYRHRVFLSQIPAAEEADDTLRSLVDVAHWLDEHVSRENPRVGRTGDVCPWTRRASELGELSLTLCAVREPRALDATLLQLKDELTDGDAGMYAGSVFRSVVAVFPWRDREIEGQIVEAHHRLKPAFLAQRLMLGEFYPSCQKPGLRNPSYRPLQSPWPLLVIRPMVEADLEFLLDRDEFVAAYLRAHGRRGAARLAQILDERSATLGMDRVRGLWHMLRSHEVDPE